MVRYTWRAPVAVPDRLEMERPESAETEEVSLFPEAQPQHPQRQQRFRLLQQHMIKVPPIRFVGDCCPPQSQYTRGRGGGCEKKKKRDNRSCLAFGSGRRIRTLTYRVRVCCATLTQSRYTRAALISADVIIAKRWKMSRGKMKKVKNCGPGRARPTGKGSMAVGSTGLILGLLLLFALRMLAVLGSGILVSGLLLVVVLVLHKAHLAFTALSMPIFFWHIQKLFPFGDTIYSRFMV